MVLYVVAAIFNQFSPKRQLSLTCMVNSYAGFPVLLNSPRPLPINHMSDTTVTLMEGVQTLPHISKFSNGCEHALQRLSVDYLRQSNLMVVLLVNPLAVVR